MDIRWPGAGPELAALQETLAREAPPPWRPPPGAFRVAGVALVSLRRARGRSEAGEPAWAAAALLELGLGKPVEIATACVRGETGARFESGFLAAREGPLLEEAVRALPRPPDVLLVHAAGRDHPRRAGLALMLGSLLDLPSAGVTSKPLVARGEEPPDEPGALGPLLLGGETVATWVRTRRGARPVVAHAGWRTSPDVAAEIALRSSAGVRMPEPIRRAIEEARRARAASAR